MDVKKFTGWEEYIISTIELWFWGHQVVVAHSFLISAHRGQRRADF